jgi:hypothetical protein
VIRLVILDSSASGRHPGVHLIDTYVVLGARQYWRWAQSGSGLPAQMRKEDEH